LVSLATVFLFDISGAQAEEKTELSAPTPVLVSHLAETITVDGNPADWAYIQPLPVPLMKKAAGSQTAFLQEIGGSGGTISQTIHISAAGWYAIGLSAAARDSGGQPFQVTLDGTTIGTSRHLHRRATRRLQPIALPSRLREVMSWPSPAPLPPVL
jgi:hypothetical protein